jgi:hypothetical protein
MRKSLIPADVIQKVPIPRFLLEILLYQNSGRNQGKTGFKRQDTNPTIRASYQLLHEHMKDERQH